MRKIKLEDYEGFLENPQCSDLTNLQLNQIIHMHGFIKLHRRPKNVLLSALSTIDLLIPLRSTLTENISFNASLTTEQVKEDLDALEWQECPVQSIETLNLTQEDDSDSDKHLHQSNGVVADDDLTRSSHTKPSKKMAMAVGMSVKKPRSKIRRRRRKRLNAAAGISNSAIADANSTAIAAAAADSDGIPAHVSHLYPLSSHWLSLGFC